jgi:hypothetical protein
MSTKTIPFKNLAVADLVVDAIYESGPTGNMRDEALSKLLNCGNRGGFRKVGNQGITRYVVLYSTLESRDWPDYLDIITGLFTYYGDNKKPGHELHETSRGGNRLLADVFSKVHTTPHRRDEVPPFFIFTKVYGYTPQAVQFRGLAVPGAAGVSSTDDLVAIWKSYQGQRFQNYKALFTVLGSSKISRSWLNDILSGNTLSRNCPTEWIAWVNSRQYMPLCAEPTIKIRSVEEQLPQTSLEKEILYCVYKYFKDDYSSFESFSASVASLSDSRIVVDQITRRSVDGGRDAIGRYRLGLESDPVYVDFALEAKCYCPRQEGNSLNTVGVRETSRLISRLRYRQFGILVTTSAVARQAYEEIREDNHPLIIISGRDIAQLLINKGYSSETILLNWLKTSFPISVF